MSIVTKKKQKEQRRDTSAVSVSALQLVLGTWRRPVYFQVGLHNAVTKEGRYRSGRSWLLSANFESPPSPSCSNAWCMMVAKQLVKFLTDNNLLPDLQSAYRTNHSTETSVLKVVADILQALDSGDLAALVLIDLSATFDTVDHATLLRRLRKS